ncbi:MAG TPA: ABC transporter substrate-binding protein [candidate division Zixibacteria bacterium]|nr:ABC transporter substrate-binding protein [candidate division Zixibacteria bacterium]
MRTALRWLAISTLLAASLPMQARTRPHYGGTVRVEIRSSNWLAEPYLRALATETLTTVDNRGEAQAVLATNWESQNGARRWVFTLRQGVRWHDGTELTAEDVARLLKSVQCAGCDQRTVRASGAQVVIESTQPMLTLPAELALPRFAIVREGEAHIPIGTGAFRVASVGMNSVRLEAFASSWSGRAFADAVEIFTSRTVRDQWLDAGVNRTDIVEVPAESIRRAQQEHLRPTAAPDSVLIALVANPARQSDPRLRQAVAATLERTALYSFAFQKQGEVSASLLADWLTGYSALFPTEPDPARARELRVQLGSATNLTVGYPADDPTLQLVAERVALNAREQGLQVQAIATTSADVLVTRIALASANPWVALSELATLAHYHVSYNEISMDELNRNERELLNSANIIPLFHIPRSYAPSERLHSLTLDPFGAPELAGAWIEDRR